MTQPKRYLKQTLAPFFLLVLILVGKEISAQNDASSLSIGSEKPVFFLTNQDKLLEGIPEDRNDSLLIKIPGTSGGIRLSKLDILFCGPTRESVFQFKRNHIPKENLEGIMKLAEWGTRNQLTESSLLLLKETQESADADTQKIFQRQIDRIEYVERLKKEADEKKARLSDLKKSIPEKDPEQKRLESFGSQIPLSVQEVYARKIQPILLRRCAAADCHQSGTPDMKLTFAQSDHRTVQRRNTLANLEQILRRVELASPAASPILNHPEIADQHGIQVYPFGADTASLKDFNTFSNWVLTLGGKIKELKFTDPIPPPNLNISAEEISEPAVSPVPLSQTNSSGSVHPVDLTDDSPSSPPQRNPKYRKITASDTFSAMGNKVSKPRIIDEFDPTPFNNKYHPSLSGSQEPYEEENE